MKRYSASLRIQSECRKIRTRKTSYLNTFNAVLLYRTEAKAIKSLQKFSSDKFRQWSVSIVLEDSQQGPTKNFQDTSPISIFWPAGIYLLKVNNRNLRVSCEICSKLTIKIPERCQCQCFFRLSQKCPFLVSFFIGYYGYCFIKFLIV